MKLKAMVTAFERRNGTSPKTQKAWEMITITLIDMGEKPRCKTPIELTLGDDDNDLTEEIEGETILVNITALEVGYKDSIRAQGSVVRQAEPAGQPPARPPASSGDSGQ